MSNQTIFRNTKHKGRTFEYVRKNEPGYVNWAKSITDPHGSLAEFVAYCKSQDEAEGKPVNAFMCPVHKCLMRGPFTVRHGETHNFGRQFFVCPQKDQEGEESCGLDGFKWADGTDPFSSASCRRAEAFHGLERDTVGVGCSTPMGVKEGDEMRRGPSGYLDPARGGRLVTGQPSGSRQAETPQATTPKRTRTCDTDEVRTELFKKRNGKNPAALYDEEEAEGISTHSTWTCGKHGLKLLGPFKAQDAKQFGIVMMPPQDFYRCPRQGKDGCSNQGGLRGANGFP